MDKRQTPGIPRVANVRSRVRVAREAAGKHLTLSCCVTGLAGCFTCPRAVQLLFAFQARRPALPGVREEHVGPGPADPAPETAQCDPEQVL